MVVSKWGSIFPCSNCHFGCRLHCLSSLAVNDHIFNASDLRFSSTGVWIKPNNGEYIYTYIHRILCMYNIMYSIYDMICGMLYICIHTLDILHWR